MKRIVIDVNGYWKVILFVEIDYDRYDIIESELTNLLAPTQVIDEIYDNIAYQYNSGFTYSNTDYRVSVSGINKQISKAELMDTVVHEIDHIQSDICDYYGIDLNSEDAAYLIGYLAKMFYKCCSCLLCT